MFDTSRRKLHYLTTRWTRRTTFSIWWRYLRVLRMTSHFKTVQLPRTQPLPPLSAKLSNQDSSSLATSITLSHTKQCIATARLTTHSQVRWEKSSQQAENPRKIQPSRRTQPHSTIVSDRAKQWQLSRIARSAGSSSSGCRTSSSRKLARLPLLEPKWIIMV